LLLLVYKNDKIVLNFHGSDLIFNTPFTKILSYFLIPILKKSHVVVPSEYYLKKIIHEFRIPSHKVFVYPSGGINRKIFFPEKSKINQEITLGFVSNFIPEKGWETFLKS